MADSKRATTVKPKTTKAPSISMVSLDPQQIKGKSPQVPVKIATTFFGRSRSASVNCAINSALLSVFPFPDMPTAKAECKQQYDILCHNRVGLLPQTKTSVIGANVRFADLSPQRWLRELRANWTSPNDKKIAIHFLELAGKNAQGIPRELYENLNRMLQQVLRSGSQPTRERDILVMLTVQAEELSKNRKHPIMSNRGDFIMRLAAEFKPPVNLNATVTLFGDLGIAVDAQAFIVNKATKQVIINSYYLEKMFEVYAKLWEENLLSGNDLQVRAGKALSLLMLAMPQRKAFDAGIESKLYQAAGLSLGILERMLDAERMLTMNTNYLKKGDPILNLLYAECMCSRGIYGRATANYEAFLEVHPGHPMALKNCAFCYHEMGAEHLGKAIDYLRQAITFYQQQAKELIAEVGEAKEDKEQKSKLLMRAEKLGRLATECANTLAVYHKEKLQILSEQKEGFSQKQ